MHLGRFARTDARSLTHQCVERSGWNTVACSNDKGSKPTRPKTPRAPTPRLVPAARHDDYRAAEESSLSSSLVFLGLMSLVDPPREGVLEAVDRCRK